jgi:hypothetical protein
MTSDTTPHSARAEGEGWAVTWLPGRVLTRNQATTAMVLAETVAGGIGDHTGKRRLFIEGWADEQIRRAGTATYRAVPVACPIGQ